MAIIEVIGGPITHRYLMRKTKDELATMYLRLLREAPGAVPEGFVIDPSILQEAGDVLEAVGASGVPLPSNWRWPLADELHGYAAMLAAAPGPKENNNG